MKLVAWAKRVQDHFNLSVMSFRRRRALLAASQTGGGNEITFYIYDGAETTPMKALPNMTWGEFVNSEYANQNSMLTDFRLDDYGSYMGIRFYHEGAMQDMTLYYDTLHYNNVHDYDVIEDGKTYYAW